MYSIYIYNKRYSSNRCVSDSMSACHVLGLSLSVDTKKSDSGAHMVMILNHKQTNKHSDTISKAHSIPVFYLAGS